MTEKIRVDYSFSPLFNTERMKVAKSRAFQFGDYFPELTISCADHWNTHLGTITIRGVVDSEMMGKFKEMLEDFKEFCNYSKH